MESKPISPRVYAWTARALKTTNPALSAVFAEKAGDYRPLSDYDKPEDARWRWCDIFDERNAYLGLLINVKGANCLILNPSALETQQVRIGDVHPIPQSPPIYENGLPVGVTINELPPQGDDIPPVDGGNTDTNGDTTEIPTVGTGNQGDESKPNDRAGGGFPSFFGNK